MTFGLGIKHKGCEPYQVYTNDYSGLTLTYFTTRSNSIPNAFIRENLEVLNYHKLFKPKS